MLAFNQEIEDKRQSTLVVVDQNNKEFEKQSGVLKEKEKEIDLKLEQLNNTIENSESEMGCYVSDETREKLSESLNEFYSKFDDPGQLLVKHHYIYDHNDLSKYTTEMTRSRHSRLHMLMRKAGIIIPHINIKEVN